MCKKHLDEWAMSGAPTVAEFMVTATVKEEVVDVRTVSELDPVGMPDFEGETGGFSEEQLHKMVEILDDKPVERRRRRGRPRKEEASE